MQQLKSAVLCFVTSQLQNRKVACYFAWCLHVHLYIPPHTNVFLALQIVLCISADSITLGIVTRNKCSTIHVFGMAFVHSCLLLCTLRYVVVITTVFSYAFESQSFTKQKQKTCLLRDISSATIGFGAISFRFLSKRTANIIG